MPMAATRLRTCACVFSLLSSRTSSSWVLWVFVFVGFCLWLWTLLGTAAVPGEGAPLRLMQRGDEFVIMAGTNPLMNSRMSGSEEDLATLSWARIDTRRAARVQLGGH